MIHSSQVSATSYGVACGTNPQGGLPFANWVTRNDAVKTEEKAPAHSPDRPRGGGLDWLTAALRCTLDRDSEALAVIQRLAYRVDRSSALATRSRAYASELQRIMLRIEANLSHKQRTRPDTSAEPQEARQAKAAIEALDERAARELLLRYLYDHAKATFDVLSGVGDGLEAKSIRMLARKAEREKDALIAWLERQQPARH